MSEENDKSAIEKVFDWYEANVPLRIGAAVLAVPTLGKTALFDLAITSGLAYLRRRRVNQFRDELITLNFQPSEEEVRTEEFIEAFLATASRVQQTRREEKIRLLTRLFSRFWADGDHTADAFDLYEEDLSVLDEVGFHELSLLFLLSDFEERFPAHDNENFAQRTGRFWKEFQDAASAQLLIDPGELESYLQRASRTGLYQPLTGAFWDYTGGRGYLTRRFYRLRVRIGTQTDDPSGNWNK